MPHWSRHIVRGSIWAVPTLVLAFLLFHFWSVFWGHWYLPRNVERYRVAEESRTLCADSQSVYRLGLSDKCEHDREWIGGRSGVCWIDAILPTWIAQFLQFSLTSMLLCAASLWVTHRVLIPLTTALLHRRSRRPGPGTTSTAPSAPSQYENIFPSGLASARLAECEPGQSIKPRRRICSRLGLSRRILLAYSLALGLVFMTLSVLSCSPAAYFSKIVSLTWHEEWQHLADFCRLFRPSGYMYIVLTYCFLRLSEHWVWLGPVALQTFLVVGHMAWNLVIRQFRDAWTSYTDDLQLQKEALSHASQGKVGSLGLPTFPWLLPSLDLGRETKRPGGTESRAKTGDLPQALAGRHREPRGHSLCGDQGVSDATVTEGVPGATCVQVPASRYDMASTASTASTASPVPTAVHLDDLFASLALPRLPPPSAPRIASRSGQTVEAKYGQALFARSHSMNDPD